MDDDFKKLVLIRLDQIDDNLERHMKRSDALEEQVEPMKTLMTEVTGVVKFLKLAGIIVAIIEGIRMVWH